MKPTSRLIAALLVACLAGGCGDEEPDSIAAWIAKLDDEDVNERYRAATALADEGARAVPDLIERLGKHTHGSGERPRDEGRHDPRQIVTDTLVLIGEPAVPALIESLTLEEELERRLAAVALQRIGVGEDHLPRLIEIMDHDNPMVAGIAGGLVVEAKTGKSLLHEVLTGASYSTRAKTRAIRALAALDDSDALQWITDALGAPDAAVRLEAVKAMNALSSRVNAADALIPLLDDEDEQVRIWASTALRSQGDAAADGLLRVLGEGSARARSLAAGVLAAHGERALAAAPRLADNLEHADAMVRVRCAAALHAVARDIERALPVLLAAAADADGDARLEAVTALAGFTAAADEVVPALIEALRGDDEAVARRAARSLGALGAEAESALETLERAALANDEVLRETAKRSIEAIRGAGK